MSAEFTNYGFYRAARQLAVTLGSNIPCCNNPPLQGLFDYVVPIPPVPPGGWIFGEPDAPWVFGDPNAGWVFGHP